MGMWGQHDGFSLALNHSPEYDIKQHNTVRRWTFLHVHTPPRHRPACALLGRRFPFVNQPLRSLPKRSSSSNKKLLQRFHVCPLLFREKMGDSSTTFRGRASTVRPVYRYVFLCPGQAQALVRPRRRRRGGGRVNCYGLSLDVSHAG